MAEVEYKGIKVGGSKLLLIVPLLGTLIGGLWGGFEVYQRYLNMESKIAKFVSPDLSHIDNHITMVHNELEIIATEFNNLKEADDLMNQVVREQVNGIKDIVATLQTDVYDLKMELKEDMTLINSQLESQLDKQATELRDVENSVELQLDKQTDNLDKQEQRNRKSVEDVNTASAANVKTIRDIISAFEIRIDAKVDRLDEKIDTLETNLDNKIMKALNNPLVGN
tara:strand:- start:8389 stop:9063 length:675 start_codon:yes stop_codon:yes gene_type:complete